MNQRIHYRKTNKEALSVLGSVVKQLRRRLEWNSRIKTWSSVSPNFFCAVAAPNSPNGFTTKQSTVKACLFVN